MPPSLRNIVLFRCAIQHRPIAVDISKVVNPARTPFRRRYNFKKADWRAFQEELDKNIQSIEPLPHNYNQMARLMKQTARRHIPRGCRTQYIAGMDQDAKTIYNEYIRSFSEDPFSEQTIALGEEMMGKLAECRRTKWQHLMESVDMTHNSKKAWRLIHQLSDDPTKTTTQQVRANAVAHQLLLNGKSDGKKQMKSQLIISKEAGETPLTHPFSTSEISTAIKSLKPGKACGEENIMNEMLTHCGRRACEWLQQFFTNCMRLKTIPSTWRRTKIVALLKPGKDPSRPKSYRPIALLSHTMKLYERLHLNRLAPVVEEHLIPQQAGFRPGKSCSGQLLNLTQHIEDGYEEGQLTAAVFIDLSSAYDTVNHRRMIWKLYRITGDAGIAQVIRSLLSNRHFFVQMGEERSRWRLQRNGLPQGSVLAPLMYNIYTNDQPIPEDTNTFIYADDRCITTQQASFERAEEILESALEELSDYYDENFLKANPTKTQCCAFHLRNREASRQLNIKWQGQAIEHSAAPKYLGVTLDRILSYKQHLEGLKGKVEARNNIMRKLTTTKWGANASTLRSTGLALCFSTAEYACSTWGRSAHAKKINMALNNTCRIITGCIKSTSVPKLYKLSGIAPPDIRRDVQASKERATQLTDGRHPLHNHQPTTSRLKSRRSFANTVQPLTNTPDAKRLEIWRDTEADAVEELAAGHHYNRSHWLTLNRHRTAAGACKANKKKWGFTQDDACECGEEQTMSHVLQCPLAPPHDDEDLWDATERGIETARFWAGRL